MSRLAAPIAVVTWNLEWAPRSRRAGIGERLEELAPDILCATEADAEILPAGGHVAECGADSGYGVRGGRRKVLLWSRWPMEEVDPLGSPGLPPGRFVATTCRTPLGAIRLIGVCIPWREARVRTGARDRSPWQDHLVYLHGLGPVLASRDPSLPTLVLGDFNQRIPRARAPEHVAHALTGALRGFVVATAGEVPGIDRQIIDHIAHSPGIEVGEIAGFDRRDADGRRLSDHDAVRLVITRVRPG